MADADGEMAGGTGDGLSPEELTEEAAASAAVLEVHRVARLDRGTELAGEPRLSRGVVGALDHDLVVVERAGPDGEPPAGVEEPELALKTSQRRRDQVQELVPVGHHRCTPGIDGDGDGHAQLHDVAGKV